MTGSSRERYSLRFKSSGGNSLTFVFDPAPPRPGTRTPALRCPTRALRGPAARTPVKLPYTIRPGGAKGTIVLDRSGKTSKPAVPPVPRGLEEVAGLACGELTIAERPVGCKATRAIVIAAHKPQPRALRVPRKGGCVVWGNKDGSGATVTFQRSAPHDAHIGKRRLLPKAAVAWDYFSRSSPGKISYTIDPGAAKGRILLE